jgi:NhaP-type Na+/H+ or K+/H+ antiporter
LLILKPFNIAVVVVFALIVVLVVRILFSSTSIIPIIIPTIVVSIVPIIVPIIHVLTVHGNRELIRTGRNGKGGVSWAQAHR